jgi:osmotically-inducible protein OsmY
MRRSIAVAALVALVWTGCGESRQEKFEKAMKAADAARTTLDSARAEYAKQETETEKARSAAAESESDLAEAQRKLDAATTSFESARGEVAKWADDASVTRLLQQRLLEEPALEHATVAARVENGVALLEGTAPAEAADRAASIARETPGVVDVQSRLTVPAPPREPTPPPVAEPAPPLEPDAVELPPAAPDAPH